jgi:hypothetical protein
MANRHDTYKSTYKSEDYFKITIKMPRRLGWGGWTRTNTVLINSEVPYRLDHAPTLGHITIYCKDLLNMGQSDLGLLVCDSASSGVSWSYRITPAEPLNGC